MRSCSLLAPSCLLLVQLSWSGVAAETTTRLLEGRPVAPEPPPQADKTAAAKLPLAEDEVLPVGEPPWAAIHNHPRVVLVRAARNQALAERARAAPAERPPRKAVRQAKAVRLLAAAGRRPAEARALRALPAQAEQGSASEPRRAVQLSSRSTARARKVAIGGRRAPEPRRRAARTRPSKPATRTKAVRGTPIPRLVPAPWRPVPR